MLPLQVGCHIPSIYLHDDRFNKGNTIEEALKLVEIFLGMIKKEVTDEEELEKLEDAIVLQNISNMPARVKCAVLAWHTLKEAFGCVVKGCSLI